jgi:hypothetical protein
MPLGIKGPGGLAANKIFAAALAEPIRGKNKSMIPAVGFNPVVTKRKNFARRVPGPFEEFENSTIDLVNGKNTRGFEGQLPAESRLRWEPQAKATNFSEDLPREPSFYYNTNTAKMVATEHHENLLASETANEAARLNNPPPGKLPFRLWKLTQENNPTLQYANWRSLYKKYLDIVTPPTKTILGRTFKRGGKNVKRRNKTKKRN